MISSNQILKYQMISAKKSDEYQSCITHQDLQLLFCSSFRVTKVEQFKFWILKNDKFKPNFEISNDFS